MNQNENPSSTAKNPNTFSKSGSMSADGYDQISAEKMKTKNRESKPEVSRSSATGGAESEFKPDEALNQLKSVIQMATEFVQRRPVLVLASVCALGLLGAVAFSAISKRAE